MIQIDITLILKNSVRKIVGKYGEHIKKELDSFLTMTHKEILQGAGTVSHEKALKKVYEEYDKYMKTHLTQAEKDYLEIMGGDIKKLKG